MRTILLIMVLMICFSFGDVNALQEVEHLVVGIIIFGIILDVIEQFRN